MSSTSGEMLTRQQLRYCTDAESALVKQFTSRLLGAKRSRNENQPWVMVTPISNGQTLLSVYILLKAQGKFDSWSSEYYDVRQDSGICVLALIP